MRFCAFVALALAVASGAFAAPAGFNGLNVKVSASSASVASVDDLKFTATVTNDGAQDVKVLKFGTVLDELPTRSFEVTKDGAVVPFQGIKLSISLDQVDNSSFVVVPAGKSVSVTHDVAALFDFSTSGTGTYSFEPITSFMVLGANEHIAGPESFLNVRAIANKVEVEVTEDAAKRTLVAGNKRAADSCTDSFRKSFIDDSYYEAKTLASTASSYISSRGASDSVYRAYFGSTPAHQVTSILNAIASENSTSRTLSCTDSYASCRSGVIAYTVTPPTNIYYCESFFDEVATSNLCSGTTVNSRDVRGGTTLHELTHAVAGTDDVVYGCPQDQALVDGDKIRNTDNFNCFTTQVYQNTRC